MSERCQYCSFDPTSLSDYCDEHRPRFAAEKPEGDVALLHDKHCEVMVDTGAYFCRCWYRARIATLTEALELIAEASYLDGACLIARRALGQGEAKGGGSVLDGI